MPRYPPNKKLGVKLRQGVKSNENGTTRTDNSQLFRFQDSDFGCVYIDIDRKMLQKSEFPKICEKETDGFGNESAKVATRHPDKSVLLRNLFLSTATTYLANELETRNKQL